MARDRSNTGSSNLKVQRHKEREKHAWKDAPLHKATIETESLVICKLQSNNFRFLRNKQYTKVHHVLAMHGLEYALKCFALNFDKAVKIICWDVNETMWLIVRKLTHVNRFHSWRLAGPNDSEWPPPININRFVVWLNWLHLILKLEGIDHIPFE